MSMHPEPLIKCDYEEIAESKELAEKYPDLAKEMPPGYVLYEDQRPTTCCGRCCDRRAMMRPSSTDVLAILPFYPAQCFRVGPGMNEDDLHLPPDSLKALGLSNEVWST